jgi:hypothetical protein
VEEEFHSAALVLGRSITSINELLEMLDLKSW